jgi:ParB family chromosome partitioning protein
MQNKEIVLIHVQEINVFNPRIRNRFIAEEIRQNIRNVGLKRPITVRLKEVPENGKIYDLVCGQGRLEAFIEAGVEKIPAVITNVSTEDAAVMSLVENIARRNYSSIELLQSVRYLSQQGYSHAEIAGKTCLDKNYIHGIVTLLDKGEHRLVNAVEKKGIPLYIAMKMMTENNDEMQKALMEAYESGELSGKRLLDAKKIFMHRIHYGKGKSPSKNKNANLSSKDIMSALGDSIKAKRRLIKKSDNLSSLITFSAAALKKLFKDVNFRNQLKVENITEMPETVMEIIGSV